MHRFALVKYHEIALKGKNRPMFERALLQAIRGATRGLGVRSVSHRHSRVIVDLQPDAPWEPVRERLREVFGIANFSLAYRLPADLETLKQALAGHLQPYDGVRTFRVRATRADKSFPMTSPEIQRDLGAFIQRSEEHTSELQSPE